MIKMLRKYCIYYALISRNTRMGGPLDILLNGRTGFLVAPGNTKEMTDAIERLLADKRLASDMGRSGRKRVIDMFTKERYARQVEDAYIRLLCSG